MSVSIQIGEKKINVEQDPAALHALLIFAAATGDRTLRTEVLNLLEPILANQENLDYRLLDPSYPKLPASVGSSLVYFAQSIMDREHPPVWTEAVAETIRHVGHVVFDPSHTDHWELIDEERNRALHRILEQRLNVDPAILKGFSIPEWVADSYSDCKDKFKMATDLLDDGMDRMIPVLDAYLLLRSRLVIVDLNAPSFGGTPQEIQLANFFRIPVLGVSDRATNSPWVIDKVVAVTVSDPARILLLSKLWFMA